MLGLTSIDWRARRVELFCSKCFLTKPRRIKEVDLYLGADLVFLSEVAVSRAAGHVLVNGCGGFMEMRP